jgi:hypothetical protein
MRSTRTFLALGLAAALIGGTSCVVRERYPVSGTVVMESPPVDRVEVVGVAPGPDFIWIGGWWSWNGRWCWNDGHWARPPHAHAVWSPGRWAPHPHGRGFVWMGGRWRG